MKRRSVPWRVRFEVLKRDGFTCAYCGARPPGVALQVDHIRPVAEGGPDDIDNLVTSCETCNGGKGGIPLGATAAAHTRAASLQRAKDVAAIDAAYNDWLREQREARAAALDRLVNIWNAQGLRGQLVLTDSGRASVGKFIGPMLEEEIVDAMMIAIERMPFPFIDPKWTRTGSKFKAALLQVDRRFRYFCGVCHRTIERRA